MKPCSMRFASLADARELLDIYRRYIALPVTFEEACPMRIRNGRHTAGMRNYLCTSIPRIGGWGLAGHCMGR